MSGVKKRGESSATESEIRERKIKLRTKILVSVCWVYLGLPFLIFAGGYLRIYYAIPVVLLVAVSIGKAVKDEQLDVLPLANKNDWLKILTVAFVVLIWIILSGIGDLFYQNSDHQVRDAIFNMMVESKWPAMHGTLEGNGAVMKPLVYYIGFWFPAALFGKLTSLTGGYLFQVFWGWLGIMLTYLLICIWRKKISIWPLWILIFFSGLDIIRQNIYRETPLFSTEFLDYLINDFSYQSIVVQVNSVYHTAIPAYVAVMLLIAGGRRKNIILLWSTLLLTATFPFVGIIPYLFYVVFGKDREKKNIEKIKEIFTFQNIVGAGLVGCISFLFLFSNIAGGYLNTIRDVSGTVGNYHGVLLSETITSISIVSLANKLKNIWVTIVNHRIGAYLIFIIFEIGIYFALLFRKYRKEPLYWYTVGSLLVIPWIRVGTSLDFCLKASIPGLFIIVILIIKQLEDWNRYKLLNIIMVVCLCIGSVTVIHQAADAIKLQMQGFKQTTLHSSELVRWSNFSGDADSFFFRHLAKEWEPAHLQELEIRQTTKQEDLWKLKEYYIIGIDYELIDNSMTPVSELLQIQLDVSVDGDVYWEDRGMLLDPETSYSLIVNGHEAAVLDYNNTSCYIPQEYFNEKAQYIMVVFNRKVKLYDSDSFYLRFE